MTQITEYFSVLDWIIFAAYLLATIAIGACFVRGGRNLDEYLLAGRSMGSVIVGMTIMASLFSGISFLAAPSESYAFGASYYLVNLAYFIATPLTILIFLPILYKARYFTVYQYLEERFSGTLRMLASGSFILRVLLWLAAATYAPALALEQATGMPLWITILCTGLVTTVYTTFGGMRAVIWTDVMQLVVLFGGQVLIVWSAINRVPGGLGKVIELGRQDGRFDISLSLDPTVRLTLWGLLLGATFMTLVQMVTDQVSVQRYLSARNLEVAKRGLWLKLLMTLPITAVFFGTGLVLYAFYQVHGDPLASGRIQKADQILPYFVVNELPHGFAGLLIAAIYAASMSTVSSGINSLTSVSLVDFIQRLFPRAACLQSTQLNIARWLTLGYGAMVVALAFLVHRMGTLLEATAIIMGLVGGPMVGLYMLGILSRRATARGALIGWMAGLAATLWVCFGTRVSFLWYALIGAMVTYVTGLMVSRFGPPPETRQLAGLVWRGDKPPAS